MKWEILKGSDKDFEGSPDWATLLTTTGGQRFFVEKHAASARLIDIYNREESKIDANPMPGQFDNIEILAERRPITEPDVNQQVTTEWSGYGLPPVGVECKHLPSKHCVVPHKVTILAHTKLDSRDIDVAVFQYGDVISFSSAKQFIPIRSPEDVARDNAVNDMAQIIEYRTGCSPKNLAGWLYDAGYRKVE